VPGLSSGAGEHQWLGRRYVVTTPTAACQLSRQQAAVSALCQPLLTLVVFSCW
jgi:hypothetical protein